MRGRTNILIVSIITRAGANQLGAPEGRRLALNSLGEFVMDEITRAIQRGIPYVIVKRRWEDRLKI